jgi:DNA-binding Lrp family transcriptional regulator
LLDEIDKIMLSTLGGNDRISSSDIERSLQDMGYSITERAIRYRIRRLETNNTILGYSVILNPSFVSNKVNRTIILKFKYSSGSPSLMHRLESYTQEQQYELESNNFIHRFADLISDFRSYESKVVKLSTYTISDEHDMIERKSHVFKILNSLQEYDTLNDKLQFIVESVVKYLDAKFARIWLVDREKNYLMLKFSAGKYKNIHGEFSKVSLDSNKIGPIVRTKKPAISNDVINDSRIRHHDWAKKERLKSFAGYPLLSKGRAIGVLGMFSKKKLSPADFEILGVFCDQVSKELASFFSATEFLSIK